MTRGLNLSQPKKIPDGFVRLNPRVEGVCQSRIRAGELPAIAPKIVLQTPMWVEPRSATRTGTRSRRFQDYWHGAVTTLIVETQNPQPLLPSGRRSAGGLLRYLDLDVVMALSLAWMESGRRDVELEQRAFFRLMGYEDLTHAPYIELRSSLRRLCETSIALYQEGEDLGRVHTFKLVDWHGHQDLPSVGGPVLIQATLSHIWEEALSSLDGWQAIDLNAYANLARNHRQCGLARVIYLFLACWRKQDGSFEVPWRSILDRYGDRRPGGQFRAVDMGCRSNRVAQALKTLHKAQVVQFNDVDLSGAGVLAKISGTFLPVPSPRLEQAPSQTSFLRPSLWNPNKITMEPSLMEEATPQKEGASNYRKKQVEYCESTLPRLIALFIPPISDLKLQQARRCGWANEELWFLAVDVLWRYHEKQTVDSASAYFCQVINAGNKDQSTRFRYRPEGLRATHGDGYQEWLSWVWTKGPLKGQVPPRKSQPTNRQR